MTPRERLLELKEAYEAAGPPLDDRDGDWVSLRRGEALVIIDMALRLSIRRAASTIFLASSPSISAKPPKP